MNKEKKYRIALGQLEKLSILVALTGMLCITSYGCNGKQDINARNLKTLQVVWKTKTKQIEDLQTNNDFIIAYSEMTFSTPCIRCFDSPKGKERWLYGDVSSHCRDICTYEDQVIAANSEQLIVFLNVVSGKRLKTFDVRNISGKPAGQEKNSPVYYTIAGLASNGTDLVIITEGGLFVFYDLSKGVVRLSGTLPRENLLSNRSPVIGQNVVVFPESSIYAYSLIDGTLIWSSHQDGMLKCLITGENLLAVADSTVLRLDLKSGKVIWSKTVDDELYYVAALDSNQFYVFSSWQNGNKPIYMYCFKIANGEMSWKKTIDPAGLSSGEPLVDNNLLYFMSRSGNLYAIDVRQGRGVAAYVTGQKTYDTGVIMSSGKVISGGHFNYLFAFKPIR